MEEEENLESRASLNSSVFKVFPNPATNRIQHNYALEQVESTHIYNSLGTEVYESTSLEQAEIEIDFAPGAYFLVLQLENGVSVKSKFVVIDK